AVIAVALPRHAATSVAQGWLNDIQDPSKTIAVTSLYALHSIGGPSYWKDGKYIDGTITQDLLTPVPEPETYAMFLAGLGMMGAVARRRGARKA
ncbi:MAG TPA: FxDxF family PEP-CTERM protein, partial [Rhodocyclaceae bacterium]|nr:FxDxF family PEP-CTERM protein [Rhodocyclaceae bacterium]